MFLLTNKNSLKIDLQMNFTHTRHQLKPHKKSHICFPIIRLSSSCLASFRSLEKCIQTSSSRINTLDLSIHMRVADHEMHTLTVKYCKQSTKAEKTETPEIFFQYSPNNCAEMFTSRGRQTKRKYIIGICAVIFVYIFLFTRYQTYEVQEVIKNVKPEKVWEYVADFSKMKTLNPTILEFKIISDQGNNEDWKYVVEYLELLSHWPYWKNQATANYHIKKVIRDRKYVYLVESVHKTCFYGVYCCELIVNVGPKIEATMCQSSFHSKINRGVSVYRSQRWHALYWNRQISVPSLHGKLLPQGSRISAEEDSLQPRLSLLAAAAAQLIVLIKICLKHTKKNCKKATR